MSGASPPRSPTRRPLHLAAAAAGRSAASHAARPAPRSAASTTPLPSRLMAAPILAGTPPAPSAPAATFSVDDIRITAPNVSADDLPSLLKKDCVLFYHPVS